MEIMNDDNAPVLTHLDSAGNARMVDVSQKAETHRTARAVGRVRISAATRALIANRSLPKGDVFAAARIAGILAAKRTGDLIPLCHPLPLTEVQVSLELAGEGVEIKATASCIGRTGVEMEALTAVSVAALTVYDMCKSADKEIEIESIYLAEKTGGRGGRYTRGTPPC